MDIWHLTHDLRRAVATGKLPARKCDMCGSELSVSIDKGDRPMLVCYVDDRKIHLSDRWFQDLAKELESINE